MSSPRSGTHFLEGVVPIYQTQYLALANNIVDVRPSVRFKVKIANFSKSPQRLVKNQHIAVVRPIPGMTPVYRLNLDDSTPQKAPESGSEELKVMPLPQNLEEAGLATAFPVDYNPPEGIKGGTTVGCLDLRHLSDKNWNLVRKALEPFSQCGMEN